jgi:hypothetical protein
MRKAKGTPFKLRPAPFKDDGKNVKTENLGEMVTDQNHLVDVTKRTTTTPDLSGTRNTDKTYRETYGPKQKAKYGSFENYVDAAEKYWEEKGKGKGGKKKVEFEKKEKPNPGTPGTPGDYTDPFTSPEGRGQQRYIMSQHRLARKNIRKNFRKGKMSREEYTRLMEENREQQMRASMAMAKNAADQGTQGRNPNRSGEQIKYDHDMSKGTEGTAGTDYTEASEEQRKNLKNYDDLVENEAGETNTGENDEDQNTTKSASKLKIGRRSSGTPFKLRKYK